MFKEIFNYCIDTIFTTAFRKIVTIIRPKKNPDSSPTTPQKLADNNIVDLADYKKQKTLDAFDQLPDAVNEYAQVSDKNFQNIVDCSLDELLEDFDIDEIFSALEDEEETPG